MTEEKKNELLLEQVTSLMQQTNNDVIAVICNRIKTIGEMSATDAIKLSNMARTTDLKEIEDILAKNAELSKKAVDEIVEKSAENNDELSAQYYKYAGKTKNEKVLETIKSRAKKSMSEGLINLSDTTAFIMDGKPLNIRETYTKAINSAIYATQQGLTDYNTAIRTTVRNLADSGLRVVDFDSGYHRRLDSQARMNILDGMRQLNQEYREEQGQEFGADGVEISVHGMCAPDHQDIQGQQYSKEDFEKLQSRLLRPIGTLNCHHTTFPIILGVSKPAYTKKRLKEIKAQSNAPVQYTDKLGNDKVVSAYDSTQKQREQETIIRRLKDRREAFRASGDDDEVAKLNKQITAQSRYYRKMSAEVGLEPKMERTRVIKAKVKKDPANVAKFVAKNKNNVDIVFDEKLNKPRWSESKRIILNLSNEYNTRLTFVGVGAEKAAGDVNIIGQKMRLSSSQPHVAVHEFFHTLADTNADKYGLTNDKEFWKEIKKVRREYHKDVDKAQDISRWISFYEHSNKSVDEFAAEAFAMAKLKELGLDIPNKYGKDYKYANKVLEIINKYFKK